MERDLAERRRYESIPKVSFKSNSKTLRLNEIITKLKENQNDNLLFRSLPNWMELQTHKPTHRRGKILRREETTEEESPEDIRQRNVKEAEILASNMGESGIRTHEILSNVGQLKKLAQLNESMVGN